MRIYLAASRSRVLANYKRFITFQAWRYLWPLFGALIFIATANAAPLPDPAVGLSILNDIDSNGNITVVNGGKVKVAFEVLQDTQKLLHKGDKIQLLRVDDDSVVSSAERGKKKSGTVNLAVKKSEGEALYVRYRRKKDGVVQTTVSEPLMSIPKASGTDLTIGVNALETGLNALETELDASETRLDALETAPPPYREAQFTESYESGVAPNASECTNWNVFRQNLVPEHYSCVQILGSAGKGVTSCDNTTVSDLATALRDATTNTVSIGGTDWFTQGVGSSVRVAAGLTPNQCSAVPALRPCQGNANWGGVGGVSSCGEPSQSISIIFR